jgi:hypothetical protein
MQRRYNIIDLWRNGIQPIMILYCDVIAAGEQTSMSKLSVLHGKNIIVNSV